MHDADTRSANSTGVYGGYSGAENAINTETFLRGGYFTNDEGIVELTTCAMLPKPVDVFADGVFAI